MTNILANSKDELKRINGLLDKKIPSYRQAYSDRTAWLMACLSELAYVKFNPSILDGKRKDFLQENILKALNDDKKEILTELIRSLEYDHDKEREKLVEELKIFDMRIIETFDCNGTQAILIEYGESIILAFRGTESTSLKDIKSDVDARTTQCETGGNIHTGFKEAFDEVYQDISEELNKDTLKDKPLFITGHSLGGALATIAAKKLSHNGGIAACYTFGSPRVGNDKWISDIKTPIYRLVNAADCVTMLPPGDEWVTAGAWVMRGVAWLRIPLISQLAESCVRWLLSRFAGYLHAGNMRYMTNCSSGQNYGDVELLYSISLFRRISGWYKKKGSKGKFLADHSIGVYRKKLMIIAERRNQITS